VYWALSRVVKISSCPPSLQKKLRAMYFSTWLRKEQIIQEPGILAGLFDQAAIPLVSLRWISIKSGNQL
jgi:hypothetical protein